MTDCVSAKTKGLFRAIASASHLKLLITVSNNRRNKGLALCLSILSHQS